MNNKICVCKACGREIAKSAKACPHCGAKNAKPFYTKWWFWVIIIVFIGIISSASQSSDNNNSNTGGEVTKDPSKATVGAISSVFDGDCGISASAEIGSNIINLPELAITITNTSSKEIAAIQFYAVPYDVYGKEITGWTTQHKLYTDKAIPSGSTTTISFQFIEQSVKTVKLYVYSVYFVDGSEWGDKDASKTKILNNAPLIEVTIAS